MKQSVLATVVFIFLTVSLHAQNKFPLKIDTAKSGKFGFQKQNRWTLPFDNSIEYPDFKFPRLAKTSTNEYKPYWRMPVHIPEGNHPMPVHVPDSTICYSIRVVGQKPN